MTEAKFKITFTEPVLGTSPANEKVYEDFISSKAPDAATITEEIEALGIDGVAEKGMTLFAKTDELEPFLFDYQVKGFFKGACGFLRSIPGTASSKLKAYKKKIDGHIFVFPRQIVFKDYGDLRICQRPLRAQTMQGERVTLAASEEVAAGASIEFTVKCLDAADMQLVREWLDYGELSGIGQWRNSGKGRFTWEEI